MRERGVSLLKIKIKMKDIIEYFIIIFMIILTGSARVSTADSGALFHSLSLILIILLALDITEGFKKIPGKTILTLAGIIIIAYYLISIVNYFETWKGLFLRFFWFFFIFAFTIKHHDNPRKIWDKLYNLIFIITLIAIAFFVAINFLNIQLPFEYIEHENIKTYYRSFLNVFCTADRYHRTNVFGFSFYRLQSFFWEPGIFAIYLNIALAYLTFYRAKKNIIHLLCYIFCMIFTLSTTGIIIAGFLVAIYIITNFKVAKKQRMLLALPLLLTASIVGSVIWIEKMTRTNVENGSYYIRLNDFIIGASLILEKPLLGFGYKCYDRFLMVSEQGNSNGIIIWGFTMGLVGLAFILVPFIYVICASSRKNRKMEILYFALYVLFNMTEPLLMSPLMLFFLAFEYCKAIQLNRSRRGLFAVR